MENGRVGLIGHEIDFWRCTPPCPLEKIEAAIRATEQGIGPMTGRRDGRMGHMPTPHIGTCGGPARIPRCRPVL